MNQTEISNKMFLYANESSYLFTKNREKKIVWKDEQYNQWKVNIVYNWENQITQKQAISDKIKQIFEPNIFQIDFL